MIMDAGFSCFRGVKMMKEIITDVDLVAYCGLYCGACRRYLKGNCPGCHDNQKAKWCDVRKCCRENSYTTCAECEEHQSPADCRSFNNFFSRVFGFLFRSDRAACIHHIKVTGIQAYAENMSEGKLHSIKRGQ